MRGRKKEVGFVCVGFLFLNGRQNFTHPEDYLDYVDMNWSKEALEYDLGRGVVPPGMLVKAENGTRIGVVVGNYNEMQKLEVLGDLLTIQKRQEPE